MKKKSAILALLLAGMMSFGVVSTAACNKKHGDEGTSNPPPIGGDVGGGEEEENPVILSEDTAISLTVGESKTITAAEGATFKSLQTSVATVDNSGKITAKSAGVAKVTATAGNSVITCTVIVLAPLSGNSQTVSKNPFTFNQTVDIGSVTSSSAPAESDPNADEFKVEFSDGAVTQNVANGCQAVEPLVASDGKYLTGWKSGENTYDFSAPVTSNLSLTAQWADLPSGVSLLKGNYESIAVEFSGSAETSTVSYRLHGGSDEWHAIDSQLIRAKGGGVRADIVGISAGVYDVKVNDKEMTAGLPVKEYDRSGYAHFNYSEGVGAYKNDGTLKDDALVIYVTEENKDTVMEEVAAANSDVNMFKIPYSGEGKNWNENGDYYAKGIGWWLNNNQYTSSNAGSKKATRPSNTYSASNGSTLAFGAFTRPIVVRFLGEVTTPEGLTSFANEDEGGNPEDNGHMARMKDMKNVTIEGVGDDAKIKGWGFHFIAGTDGSKKGLGKSFEVRNLTFDEYPEDAIGMEGQASSTKITAPVERCWIHNNTFLPGRCDNPAPKQTDKKEGDGSCDFKRGYYFTCSYNYFEYCHKTNLIGSSDSSLQYNLTYHHNIWYQCGSRIPLTRQANVHFYNNFVFGDPAQSSTPYDHISKPALSYVHSLRANCYLFSEANYYEGCKNVSKDTGGAAKAYANTFYACSDGGTGTLTLVDTREQTVSNKCEDPTNSTSYATFDTDPNLFYYDEANKKTDALLDDSIGARVRCVLYAGAQGHSDVTADMQEMNTNAPKVNFSITSALKAKGQVATFSVAANTMLTIDATGETPQVIRNDGKVYLEAFTGSRTVMLDAGVYMVCSGKKDKEITINSLSLQEDSAAAKQARVEDAKKAIEAIPNPVTRSSGSAIEKAKQAYANLITEEEKTDLGAELTERLSKAQAAYEEVIVAYAIARIEYIGTVTEYSGNDIQAAVTAYNAISATAQSKVTNYSKLTAAQTTFAQFALDNLQNEINRLPLSTALDLVVDSKPAVELAISLYTAQLEEYNALEEDDQEKVNVTNVNASLTVLNAALAQIEAAEKEVANLATFKELLEATTVENVTLATGGALKSAYESLTAAQKEDISADDMTKYNAIMVKYEDFVAQTVECSFDKPNSKNKTDGTPTNDMFTLTGGSNKDGTVKVGDKTFTHGLKIGKNGAATISFTVSGGRTLTLYFDSGSSGKEVVVDGTTYTIGANGVTEITIEDSATAHTITSGGKEINLFYLTLMPVA